MRHGAGGKGIDRLHREHGLPCRGDFRRRLFRRYPEVESGNSFLDARSDHRCFSVRIFRYIDKRLQTVEEPALRGGNGEFRTVGQREDHVITARLVIDVREHRLSICSVLARSLAELFPHLVLFIIRYVPISVLDFQLRRDTILAGLSVSTRISL